MKVICSYKFPKGTRRRILEESMVSAIVSAECIFGKPRVRTSGMAYYLADSGRGCILDVSSEVGEHVAQVFTGILINSLGEEKFKVRRIEGEHGDSGLAEGRTTAPLKSG